MPRLENKLLELGYTFNCFGYYYKYIHSDTSLSIRLWVKVENESVVPLHTAIFDNFTGSEVRIYEQKHIDLIQFAYNQLQQDLEVLKKCK